jgi:Leucine rich repeat
LNGSIPLAIYKLSNLEVLFLSSNQFSGPISNGIFGLSSLQFLYLDSNYFNGTFKLSLLQHLSNLSDLYLSNNQLSVEDVSDEQLQLQFPKIRLFGLASCNLSQIPRLLAYQDAFMTVDLSNNHLQGVIPSWMFEKFTHLTINIPVLNLSNNMFTGVENISPYLNDSCSFGIIDFSFNKIKGVLPLIKSYYLDYSNNEFSIIPSNYTLYLNNAYFLRLSTNKLTGEVPPSICEAPLLFIDLSNNNLSGLIPSCILGAPNLQFLNLTGNRFHGMVPHNISQSCGLLILDLSSNYLDGDLPRSLTRCKNLMLFGIRDNHIMDTFPFWLGEIADLQVLILRSNLLYGTLELPSKSTTNDSLFQNLRIIDLASNNFSGSLPPLLFENLRSMMNFSLNELTINKFGNIFVNSGFTTYIERYGISVPYGISITITEKGNQMVLEKGLTALMVEIDLSENRFSSDIPEIIGTLSALRALNLSHNLFTGSIPRAFKNLSRIESLDLSLNNLSGNIPQELVSLDSLSRLNLSFNNLVGRIPQSPHFSTFDNSSFVGNPGLCGVPLSKQCEASSTENNSTSHPTSSATNITATVLLCLFIGLGFGTGFALVIVYPVIKRARNRRTIR